ncbi:Hypothetical_protein [Hexamita inflata]|uniref:Hypothetical_protein n=1 Tax=Hexamita inflata TaxID=28002 RepID=A0ABP1GL89_9EUKA
MPWNFQDEIVDGARCLYIYHTHQHKNTYCQVDTVNVAHVLVQGFQFELFDLNSIDFQPKSLKIVNCTVDFARLRDFSILELLDCRVVNEVQMGRTPVVRKLVLRSFVDVKQLRNIQCNELILSSRLNSQSDSEPLVFGEPYKIDSTVFQNLIVDVSALKHLVSHVTFRDCTVVGIFDESYKAATTRFIGCAVDIQSIESLKTNVEYDNCRVAGTEENERKCSFALNQKQNYESQTPFDK